MENQQNLQQKAQSESQPKGSGELKLELPRKEAREILVPHFTAFQITVIVVTLLATSVVSFMAGVVYTRQTAEAYSDDFDVFWQSWDYLDENFYYEVPEDQKRVYGATQGMVAAFEDPYTIFSPPQQAEVIRQDLSGIQYGIGAYINTNEEGRFFVVRPIPGSPAEEAGLQGGDIFVAVDGESTAGWTQQQLVDNVKGEKDTQVTLTMERDGEIFEVTIRRYPFEEKIVFGQMFEDVAYLKLTGFKAVADGQMQEEFRTLLENDPRALIFDLRGNGGGFLNQAEAVADLFLDEGNIVITKTRNDDPEYLYAEDGDMGEDIFMVVLIDGSSASASEVVAGALQDRNRAVLIGQQSFGKGIVQSVVDFPDGSQLKFTSSAWYTPSDRAIHEVGLTPDIVIEGDQYANGDDLPLEAALDYINRHTEAPESVSAPDYAVFGG